MNRLQASRAILVTAWVALFAVPFDVAQGRPVAAQRRAMYQAATTFLESLTPEQRQLASFPFDSPERQRWGFDTVERLPRPGLPMDRMSEPQRMVTAALLQTGLSERGYQMATAIMNRETVRQADPLDYSISIFGTPSPDGTWSWRFEGPDLSLNFTIVRGSLAASTPSFFGGVLKAEEDAGRMLLKTFDEGQHARTAAGVPATDMSDGQRELLMQVIRTYNSAMAFDVAEARMARLRNAGLDGIIFVWAGSTEPGRPHQYRVLGPTFLIEYTSGSGTDAHSVWRDFERDFGRDLLK
jgi:hypothetical protein